MIAEAGLAALWLAGGLAAYQFVLMLLALRSEIDVVRPMRAVAMVQGALTLIAFAALLVVFARSDMSVKLVFENSHSAKPFIYKIAGAWGNHEGSMLMWVTILAVAGAFVALFSRRTSERTLIAGLGSQSVLALGFYAFLLVASNPFARVFPAPADGQGLNPLLLDPGLAFHPPTLYLGYVGLSVAFSLAVGALLTGEVDSRLARAMRPWVLGAWVMLTLGITAGSYWAYYELGWGGWWFWDPVENASLMPWLAGTALLHSAVVMEKRNSLKVWTILLAILTFSLSLIGTFLVRSGVLTSVHTFSTDPARGLFILVILMVFIGGSLALFAWRAPLLKQGGLFAPISRESALVFNNLFLATACATVFVGTLSPLVLEALTGDKISVGAPFFNLTFGPLFVPLLVAVPFGPLLAWKRGDLYGVAQRLLAAFAVAMVGLAATFVFTGSQAVLAPFGIGLAFFVMAGAITDIAERLDLRSLSIETIGRRAAGLPRSAWGTAVAHFSLGITLLGIVCGSH